MTIDALTVSLLQLSRPAGAIFKWHRTETGALYLDEIHLPRAQRGNGSAFLASVLGVADSLGLAVELVADPTDRDGDPDTDALVRWYGRFGFSVTGEDPSTMSPLMSRKAVSPPGVLFHVTAKKHLASIMADGLRPGAYLSNREDIRDYYVETVKDDGDEPVVLLVDMGTLNPRRLSPDRPGLEEPITTVLDLSEGEVWESWEESDQTALDCLKLIGSVRYRSRIPAALLRVAP